MAWLSREELRSWVDYYHDHESDWRSVTAIEEFYGVTF